MQHATVSLSLEVSNLTAEAVCEVAKEVGTTAEQTAAFLLRKGFSNLSKVARPKGSSFPH